MIAATHLSLYERSTRHFLAPIVSLLDDPQVSEIMINGPSDVYCERRGRIEKTDIAFLSEKHLLSAAKNIAEFVGRPLNQLHPSVDARLPDGSRVHILLPPASRVGLCITIRKFRESTFNLQSMVDYGSLSALGAEFLRAAVRLHQNMVISGGTGTGKTSLLNALSAAIDPAERIIVIEDSSELQLRQPHTVYLETQPPDPRGRGGMTIRDLFVASLRMRPDRIVVGEIRRGEALDLIQSMLSGHSGSLSTVHANTPRDAATRLETLCLMSDVGLPIYVARTQVASALHLVVQITRFDDGSRKVVEIAEALPLSDQQQYQFRSLFKFVASGRDAENRIQGELRWTGVRPQLADVAIALGKKPPAGLEEIFDASPIAQEADAV